MSDLEHYDARADAVRFLRGLTEYADSGWVVITCFGVTPADTRIFAREAHEVELLWDDLKPFIVSHEVYVRLTTTKTKPGPGERGLNSDTHEGLTLQIDLDEKSGWTPELAWAMVERLRALGFRVSCADTSGHGWHIFMMLDEPMPAADHGRLLDRAQVTFLRIGHEVSTAAGLDPIDIDTKVYDLSRVMRVPGTINNKDPQAPRQCMTFMADFDERNSFGDLDELLDPAPVARVLERRFAVGAPDDPNNGAPGREFNASIDGADLVLELFPGFEVTHVDSEGNVYIARGDRRTHGIVRYADDGHVAIYSETTLRDMQIPAGSMEDKTGPWWPFNLLAVKQFAGDFGAAARHLANVGWHGQQYGTGGGRSANPPSTPEEIAQAAAFMEMLNRPRTAGPSPTTAGGSSTMGSSGPTLTVVPDQPEPDAGADEPEPFDWGPGRLDVGRMLEAFGLEVIQQVGPTTWYRATLLDGGSETAATVQQDGTVVLGPVMGAAWPGTPVNVPLTWQQLLMVRFPDDVWRQVWHYLVRPEDLPREMPPLMHALRAGVIGVEGVGEVEPEPYLWATADEIIARPQPPATLLWRAGWQGLEACALLYERRTSTVFGASETTKTWLAALAALDTIRGDETTGRPGRDVMWLDIEEPGHSQGAYRLAQLGATPAELRRLINLDSFMPELIASEYGVRSINTRLRDKLVEKVRETGVGLIVVDSFSELAGSQDLDDNQKRDVTYLRNHVLGHLAKVAALFIIDHIGHNTGPREAGSVNKRNAADGVRLYVQQVRRFAPGRPGKAFVWLMKDRHASVARHAQRVETKFPGEKVSAHRDLIAVFELWDHHRPLERAQGGLGLVHASLRAGNADDLRSDAEGAAELAQRAAGLTVEPLPSEVDPSTLGKRPANSVDLFVEMRLRGSFSSKSDAYKRMELHYGVGERKVQAWLDGFVVEGKLLASGGGGRGSSTGYALAAGKPDPTVEAALAARRKVEAEAARAELEADLEDERTVQGEQATADTFDL